MRIGMHPVSACIVLAHPSSNLTFNGDVLEARAQTKVRRILQGRFSMRISCASSGTSRISSLNRRHRDPRGSVRRLPSDFKACKRSY
eukprot:152147-Hanusia_phi.AAC.1